MRSNHATGIVGALVILAVILLIVAAIFGNIILGVHGWGPYNTFEATVISKHMDISGSGENKSSHYMVTTDAGVFEVQNGWTLVFNSDEIYGKLIPEHRYHIRTRGNKVVNFWMQEYPYIVEATEIKTSPGIEAARK